MSTDAERQARNAPYQAVMGIWSDRHHAYMDLFTKSMSGGPDGGPDLAALERLKAHPFHNDPFNQEADAGKAHDLLEVAVDLHGDRQSLDQDEFHYLMAMAGRKWGPRFLWVLDVKHALTEDSYPEVVPFAWSLAEFPGQSLTNRQWRVLFNEAGFTVEHQPAERPTEPIRLWRGAWASAKRGMAWTDERRVAEHFRDARYAGKSGRRGRLYTVLAPAERLLARIHEAGRHEHEWVLDTRDLDIEEVKP